MSASGSECVTIEQLKQYNSSVVGGGIAAQAYPVGAIYMSTSAIPSTLFGGS